MDVLDSVLKDRHFQAILSLQKEGVGIVAAEHALDRFAIQEDDKDLLALQGQQKVVLGPFWCLFLLT
jgi:hypothetical protein